MGFSVSGSFVVVLLGLFVALGIVHASGTNTMERLSAANADQTQRLDTVQRSALDLTSVSVTGDCSIEIRVNNTGSTTLALEDTTLLLENDHQTGWRDGATVDGDDSTDLWLPGEQLVVTRSGLGTAPTSVSVVTGLGVTAREGTEDLVC